MLEGRDSGLDTRIVGDGSIGERNVEVLADENPFAGDVDARNRCFQSFAAIYVIRSTMRQLNPHSLSYQLTTLAQ